MKGKVTVLQASGWEAESDADAPLDVTQQGTKNGQAVTVAVHGTLHLHKETSYDGESPHHELHLPPVGPQVSVALDGKHADVVLADVPHQGSSASLVDVWKVAFPGEDAAPLHFDLVGSDGFRPGSRPACSRLLSGAEVSAARIDVVTHDVSYDDGVQRPGCYRVKAVVRVEATR
jgi:hypothetical protein